MGTSSSYRSPATPRWRPVRVGLENGMSPERLRSEVFNAGSAWSEQFGSSAVAAFVVALNEAFERMPSLLRAAERPELAVSAIANEARSRALGETSGELAAVALAERALLQTLTDVARGTGTLADISGETSARAWEANRGDRPSDLIRPFLGRVLAQFAEHVISRDIGSAAGQAIFTSRQVRAITAAVAANAAAIAGTITIGDGPASEVWSDTVRRAFRDAARIDAAQ